MCSANNSVVKRLLIPIVTKGGSYHWNLCLLSIADNGNAKLVTNKNLVDDEILNHPHSQKSKTNRACGFFHTASPRVLPKGAKEENRDVLRCNLL